MAKKIIVTGALGQLGREIRKISDSSGNSFVFTDLDTLDLSNSQDAIRFLESHAPDVIINCAAYTAVDKAEEEEEKAMQINAGIPEMLASFSTQTGCRILHISTDYVFRGNFPRPLREEDETGPESVYGRSKLKGEEAFLGHDRAVIVRTSWLYSSFGNNFVKSIADLLSKKAELKVVFDQAGSPTFAGDLASVLLTIADQNEQRFVPGIYHYSNEGIASWYDLAVAIREHTGDTCRIIPIETKDYPLPAPRPAYAVLNKEKIKEHFDIVIPHWRSSLIRCLEILNK